MKLGGWHHIALPVPDLDAAVQWYQRVLYAQVQRRTDIDQRDVRSGRSRQAWLSVGATVVNLAEADPVSRRFEQHFCHYAIATGGGDLAEWLNHLRREGVAILGPYGHGGLPFLSVYFDDPDGYRWELVIDYPDYETARREGLRHGGKLGNPTATYDWE